MARWFMVAGVAVYPLVLMFYQGWRSQSGLVLLAALALWISNRSPDLSRNG